MHTLRLTGSRTPPPHGDRSVTRGRSADMQYSIAVDRVTSGQDGLHGEWAMSDRGPTRTGIGVKTASGAQVLERCRFRNACGRPRSDGCRSVRARPESERRQWVGWTIGPPSVALSTYRASR